MFNIGLVVGKFAPLHKGHEHVINTALSQCKHVVIISYTNLPDAPSAVARRLWLTTRFPVATVIVLENQFPPDDASEEAHRMFCAALCTSLGLQPDAIFGSEDYIAGFSRRMTELTGKHVSPQIVDKTRERFAICGTTLRTNPTLVNEWCSTIVSLPLAKRILLIGGESTGKSTLAAALTKAMPGWGRVDEYGREYGERNQYTYESMLHIARTQVYDEESAMTYYPNGYVVCDTSPLTTLFYSERWYDRADVQLQILAQRKYDHVFLCHRDFPYAYEEGRSGPAFADDQQAFFNTRLQQPYTDLYGSIGDRVTKVIKTVKEGNSVACISTNVL